MTTDFMRTMAAGMRARDRVGQMRAHVSNGWTLVSNRRDGRRRYDRRVVGAVIEAVCLGRIDLGDTHKVRGVRPGPASGCVDRPECSSVFPRRRNVRRGSLTA